MQGGGENKGKNPWGCVDGTGGWVSGKNHT